MKIFIDDQPHYLTREGKRVHSRQVSWLKICHKGGLPDEEPHQWPYCLTYPFIEKREHLTQLRDSTGIEPVSLFSEDVTPSAPRNFKERI